MHLLRYEWTSLDNKTPNQTAEYYSYFFVQLTYHKKEGKKLKNATVTWMYMMARFYHHDR